MVSKASEDLPEPETQVTTVMAPWGMSKSMFFRLWTRAPRTRMASWVSGSGGGASLGSARDEAAALVAMGRRRSFRPVGPHGRPGGRKSKRAIISAGAHEVDEAFEAGLEAEADFLVEVGQADDDVADAGVVADDVVDAGLVVDPQPEHLLGGELDDGQGVVDLVVERGGHGAHHAHLGQLAVQPDDFVEQRRAEAGHHRALDEHVPEGRNLNGHAGGELDVVREGEEKEEDDARGQGGVPDGQRNHVAPYPSGRSEEHTSELQSRLHLVFPLLLFKHK